MIMHARTGSKLLLAGLCTSTLALVLQAVLPLALVVVGSLTDGPRQVVLDPAKGFVAQISSGHGFAQVGADRHGIPVDHSVAILFANAKAPVILPTGSVPAQPVAVAAIGQIKHPGDAAVRAAQLDHSHSSRAPPRSVEST